MFVQLRPIFCSFSLQQIATNKKCLDGSWSSTCSTIWLALRYEPDGWRAFLTSLQLDSLVTLASSWSHPTTYPPIVKHTNTFPPAHAVEKTYHTDLSRFIPSVSIACNTICWICPDSIISRNELKSEKLWKRANLTGKSCCSSKEPWKSKK